MDFLFFRDMEKKDGEFPIREIETVSVVQKVLEKQRTKMPINGHSYLIKKEDKIGMAEYAHA